MTFIFQHDPWIESRRSESECVVRSAHRSSATQNRCEFCDSRNRTGDPASWQGGIIPDLFGIFPTQLTGLITYQNMKVEHLVILTMKFYKRKERLDTGALRRVTWRSHVTAKTPRVTWSESQQRRYGTS